MPEKEEAQSRRLQAAGQHLANQVGSRLFDEQLEEEGWERPELLTAQEVARSARLVPETVQRACKRGEIPGAFKLANRWRIPREGYLEWIATAGTESAVIRRDPPVRGSGVGAQHGEGLPWGRARDSHSL
jgi:Helix-turn-helix domain